MYVVHLSLEPIEEIFSVMIYWVSNLINNLIDAFVHFTEVAINLLFRLHFMTKLLFSTDFELLYVKHKLLSLGIFQYALCRVLIL